MKVVGSNGVEYSAVINTCRLPSASSKTSWPSAPALTQLVVDMVVGDGPRNS